MPNSNYRNSETDRRLANIIRIGTVAESDYQKPASVWLRYCRV